MKIIKFLTAGNVDDGKSTLIGRLLHDTKSLKIDQIEFVRNFGNADNESELNYALFTDGLSSEREQGITIDVSYQYFSFGDRRYIIADCPGHTQYTRNMVTGASQSDIFVLLVNASKSIQDQTIRHFRIAQLLRMRKVIVCINKMDLVDYSEEIFNQLKNEIYSLNTTDPLNIVFIPICATKGDNVINSSKNMDWYKGNSLLKTLESVNFTDENQTQFRLPVQLVEAIKSVSAVDRFLYGSASGGSLSVGDEVSILPAGLKSRIKAIFKYKKAESTVHKNDYCTLLLEDDIDVSRGDVIIKAEEEKVAMSHFSGKICWFDTKPLNGNSKYLVKIGTSEVTCQFDELVYLQINESNGEAIKMNDLFVAKIKLAKPLVFDIYSENKGLGSFIVIDPVTNHTVAGGIILKG